MTDFDAQLLEIVLGRILERRDVVVPVFHERNAVLLGNLARDAKVGMEKDVQFAPIGFRLVTTRAAAAPFPVGLWLT